MTREIKKITKIAIWVSIVWVLLMFGLFVVLWPKPLCMDLNEWGDFFAGAFSPLALFWLVAGYWQQGEELRENTRVLGEQKEAIAAQTTLLANDRLDKVNAAVAPIEPDFYITTYGTEGWDSLLLIINVGHEVHDVIFSTDEYETYDFVPVAVWENGERNPAYVKDVRSGSNEFNFKVNLIYTNVRGEQRKQTYAMKLGKSYLVGSISME